MGVVRAVVIEEKGKGGRRFLLGAWSEGRAIVDQGMGTLACEGKVSRP